MHGPAQQRMRILDSDMARANALPEDYEADLDLEWSNPSEIFSLFSEKVNVKVRMLRSVCRWQ